MPRFGLIAGMGHDLYSPRLEFITIRCNRRFMLGLFL